MTTTIPVAVYHNTAQDPEGRSVGFFGYQPEHTLTHVADMEVPVAGPEQVAERVYHLLNVGDDPEFGTPDPQAVAYRARRNRSLSVGDVVVLAGDVALAVDSFGFRRVRVDREQITNVEQYGTTPLAVAR
jgi:hypothetical protein